MAGRLTASNEEATAGQSEVHCVSSWSLDRVSDRSVYSLNANVFIPSCNSFSGHAAFLSLMHIDVEKCDTQSSFYIYY